MVCCRSKLVQGAVGKVASFLKEVVSFGVASMVCCPRVVSARHWMQVQVQPYDHLQAVRNIRCLAGAKQSLRLSWAALAVEALTELILCFGSVKQALLGMGAGDQAQRKWGGVRRCQIDTVCLPVRHFPARRGLNRHCFASTVTGKADQAVEASRSEDCNSNRLLEDCKGYFIHNPG